ncbi:copper amine oxidase N-terminal domain-containing protein [Paenibacillus riograndensis]|uniref:copper amine oxidase N-terminal domain-containing protein n=1 Tax=Paenibacillus riograndensis TaxID=483937 RepID=UPI000764AC1B|nr:copper amine oxidase N-terminal domain-containing protein [Paenibacillus riograndensis]
MKINDYYVLYTSPKAPYVDKNNRLLIPLRSISELLGATVGYDVTTKVASIEMNNKVVKYQVNSKKVTVDEADSTLDTVPVLYKGSIFIPLSSFVLNFGIKNEWSQNDKLYTLTGDNLMQSSLAKNWEEFDSFASLPANNLNAFRPISYNYNTKKHTVTIKSQNISGSDIAAGHEGVHPYFIFEETVQYDDKSRPRPSVKKDEVVETIWNVKPVVINGVTQTLQYILVQGRSLK